jgi:predicted nucleic acid-binding protein
MSDKYFVDTNILVYAHDRSAGLKHQRAQVLIEQLWHSGQGVLSTQVLQELCVSLRRQVESPIVER